MLAYDGISKSPKRINARLTAVSPALMPDTVVLVFCGPVASHELPSRRAVATASSCMVCCICPPQYFSQREKPSLPTFHAVRPMMRASLTCTRGANILLSRAAMVSCPSPVIAQPMLSMCMR